MAIPIKDKITGRRKKAEAEPQQKAPPGPLRVKKPDRLLLLVSEGSLSFRIVGFPGMNEALDYAREHAFDLGLERSLFFWAYHSQTPPRDLPNGPEAQEVVVLVRSPRRADAAELYSFADVEAAYSFIRQAAADGLDLNLVLLYWAALLPVDELAATAQEAAAAAPALARAAARTWREATTSEPAHTQSARVETETRPAEEPDAVPAEDQLETSIFGLTMQRVQAWADDLFWRMVAAALLKEKLYERVDKDPRATGRAWQVALIVAVASAIGGAGGTLAVPWHAAALAAGWVLYTGIIYFAAGEMFRGRRVPFIWLLRGTGLALAPGIFLIFGAVPVYGPLFTLGITLWILAATAVAAMIILELDRESAIISAVIAWPIFFGASQVLPRVLT